MSSTPNGVVLPLLFFLYFSASFVLQNGQVFASPVQVQSFKRLDPLSSFKYYNGVYDVRNKHYWAVRLLISSLFISHTHV